MNKINVVLDTSPLNTGSNIRGIGAYTRLLKESLSQREDVQVISVETKEQLKQIKKSHPNLNKKNTVIHYPFFDLFFSTLPFFHKFKTVVTVHDVIPLKFPEYYKPGKKGFVRHYKQLLALRHADHVITDSRSSQQDIIKHLNIKPQYVDVVHLAASPELTPQSAGTVSDVLAKYNIPAQYVLYVGDINYNKNIPQLIKMAKFLPDNVQLVCVGKNFTSQDIPEWKWIETQLALSDVAHRVHFITTIDIHATTELSALYSGAVAYIQPSLYEGFGLPVIEAMQTKCPVIASNNSSLIEVAGEHALLVTPEAEHFAEAVKTVMDWSKTHRQEVISRAFQWSKEFSWEKVAAETRKVYAKVLGQQ
jgi:glycosyltransferase involved in cell wall biosynthesis